jgi:gliding motility-associated lipoprotein GldJ
MLGSALLLVNCGGGGNTKKGGGTKRFTSLTGWKPNDTKGWFFTGKQQKQKGWPGMVYIEGGTFVMGMVKDDVMHDWNNTPRRMQVNSFFIAETEITNYEYRAYTTWMKFVFPPYDSNFRDLYFGTLPDTLVWNNKLSRNDYSETYFRAPEFNNYPVVGVSWLQASRYCEWLTDRATEKELMNQGVITKDMYTNESNNSETSSFTIDKFKANDPEMQSYINDQRWKQKTGVKTQNQRVASANRNTTMGAREFRLPTEVEWEFAALGMQKDREYNLYQNKEPQIEKLKGKKGRNRGMYIENYKMGAGDYSGVAGWGNDASPVTSDVRQYPSNDVGVYGMFGNVAEWTADIYRPIIDEEANDFNYYRGNISQAIVRNDDGTPKMVEEIQYDTLMDGRPIYKRLPGQYERRTLEDNRNYRDGDFQSSLDAGYGKELDSSDTDFSMYNSPKVRFIVDENGRVILEKDPKDRTSTISNEIRVVKGGSWLDGAYWLDPGQRRYRDERKAFSWIGFRVAQDAKPTGKATSRKKR